MELIDVVPSEINFVKQIHRSENSKIFVVVIRNRTCVMKVVGNPCQSLVCSNVHQQHHHHEPNPLSSPLCQTSPHVREATAYQRLKMAGVCDSGIVPQFYGTIKNLDAKQCMPHLHMFLEDSGPPSAILLEYIPDMQALNLTNYSKKRMGNFINGIEQIHKALVLHDDIYPRNMMVVQGDPERAIWIDFDRAQTRKSTGWRKAWISDEKQLVAAIGDCMVSDQSTRSTNLSTSEDH